MCSICDQTFSRRTFYERHIDGHTRNSCQTCGQSFGRRRSLVLHMIREHQVLCRNPYEWLPFNQSVNSANQSACQSLGASLSNSRRGFLMFKTRARARM